MKNPAAKNTVIVIVVLGAIAAGLLAAPKTEGGSQRSVLGNRLDVSNLGNRVLVVAPPPRRRGPRHRRPHQEVPVGR